MRYAVVILIAIVSVFSCKPEKKYSKLKGCGFISEAPKLREGLEKILKPKTIPSDQKIVIPIIFHVIYKNDNENISTAAIQKEIDELNADFQMLNGDASQIYAPYKKLQGNPNVSFVLADISFPGSADKGIKRVKRTKRGDLYKSDPVIEPGRYMNVYSGNIGSDGFTYSYAWNNPRTDAIFLYYEWIGGSFRLLTHETGHWLGLFHTFQDGCSITNDEISDTPPQAAATGLGVGCDPNNTASQCKGNSLPMYNNFMDYSDCRVMFTLEQSKVIRQTIFEHRPGLLR